MNTRVILVVPLVVAALPLPAAAYVRTVTEAGALSHWEAPCVTIEISLGAPPPVSDSQGYFEAASAAGATWSQAALDGVNRCSNVIFTVAQTPDVAGLVGMDYHNRMIFRQAEWCRDPPPTDPNEPSCYDASALAITTVFQLKTSGEILDADMEINAKNYDWGDYVTHPEQFTPSKTHDFQGAVTHELGHVIGLQHTCFSPSQPGEVRPVDNKGNPVPDCSLDNPPSITQATMYVSVGDYNAEVGLRSLSPDDVQGACDIYPFTSNFVCVPPSHSSGSSSGGCTFSAQPGVGSIACALALLALALVVRRRRS